MRRLAVVWLSLLTSSAAAADGVAERARAGVRDVLRGPEFGPLADADRLPELPEIERSWIEAIARTLWDIVEPVAEALAAALRWIVNGLARLLGGLRGAGAGGGGGPGLPAWTGWVVAAVGVGLVVWLVARLVRTARAARAAPAAALSATASPTDEEDALARSPEDWRRRARKMAERGDRVAAIRALYLELLAALHRAGAIDYDRTRTNTAYARDVAAGHPAHAPFLTLTGRFDRAVYGLHEPSAEDVDEATREVDAVRSAFARESVRA